VRAGGAPGGDGPSRGRRGPARRRRVRTLLLPGATACEAAAVVERARLGEDVVAAAHGIAVRGPDGEDAETLSRRADERLYALKQSRRDSGQPVLERALDARV
jgi:hypothetical protein